MKEKRSNQQSPQEPFKEALNTPTSEIKHLKQATNLRECKKEQESLYTDLQNLPLQEALKELRVRGVEFKALYEITYWDRRFKNVSAEWQPKTNIFKHVSAAHLKGLDQKGGNIKLLSTGLFKGWTTEKLAGENLNEGEVISIPSGGRAHIKHYKGKFVDSGNILATAIDHEATNLKFVFYYLKTQQFFLDSAYRGAPAHPDMPTILSLKIPLPPLFIQERIVTILDCLTELTAELTARKKQFHYYLNALLDFGAYSLYEFNVSKETSYRLVEQVRTELQKSQDTGTQVTPLKDGLNPPTSLIKHPLLKESFRVEWVRLGEIFNIKNGYTPSKSRPEFWQGGTIPWFRMDDIRA
uniref:restriction endonuclease subunit S n=1 Tax=Helicobacter suis TaxID=104628 RepID=UPI0013D6AA0D